jgi:ribosomal protein S18 acetylase RimI-like enzyme
VDDSTPLTMDCMAIALTVGVRRAGPEDAWAVAFVLKHAFSEYEPLYVRKGYEATTPKATEVVTRMQEGPVWVAARGQQIVGTASVVRKETGFYLRGMAVLPMARSLGIGRLLLEHIERVAVEENCARLFLSTTPFLTRAICLYEAFGFKATAEGPHELFGTPLLTMEKLIVPKSGLTSIKCDGEGF